ncbi:hypothetical protein EYF80_057384 [Liparis tanakae]|uniref:Uncharacterized protein n=1 Tax=Liparis tanakae TaxID=230148 RepID=A0A4Z2EUH7_9TELE|nr:hypothetical protein EYF80_057384 [Liparis tanakae]
MWRLKCSRRQLCTQRDVWSALGLKGFVTIKTGGLRLLGKPRLTLKTGSGRRPDSSWEDDGRNGRLAKNHNPEEVAAFWKSAAIPTDAASRSRFSEHDGESPKTLSNSLNSIMPPPPQKNNELAVNSKMYRHVVRTRSHRASVDVCDE